jgi:hypothetical protein
MMVAGSSVMVRNGTAVSGLHAAMTGAMMSNAATIAETIVVGIVSAGARTADLVETMATNPVASMIRIVSAAAPMIAANPACPVCQVAVQAFDV